MAKVVINGFGRIGRTILRLLSTSRQTSDLEVVAINDIAGAEQCAYLLKYDSTYGPFAGSVDWTDDALIVDETAYPFSSVSDLSKTELAGTDLILECTGKADDAAMASAGLRAGAKRVLISGPSDAADLTIVLGANDDRLAGQKIVSNASCTTNALAPIVSRLDETFGLKSGHMTTIHCYTGSQPTIDAPRGGFERSRAAALSMVPTTTSAGRLFDQILPQLKGRVSTSAVRVPTASVSAVDFVFRPEADPTAAEINTLLQALAGPLIGVIEEPLVSSDLRGRPESIIMGTRETRVVPDGQCRVFGWYDNEWGFANRMIDVAERMTA